MPKNFKLAIALFVSFVLIALFVSRCDFEARPDKGGVWDKFTRRLFDEDMPNDAAKAKRRYDMTDIGSADSKTDR